MDAKMLGKIDAAYARLESKQTSLVQALSSESFEVESGWYNGHYHRGDESRFVRESYPIPVISLKGFCDIEIQFDKISVSAKMQRDAAQAYSFEKFAGYEFEAYGVEDYLADFYHAGQSIHEMQNSIRACSEKEIGFSFTFRFEADGKQLLEFVNLLCHEGFYY